LPCKTEKQTANCNKIGQWRGQVEHNLSQRKGMDKEKTYIVEILVNRHNNKPPPKQGR
jgi:hypothetical protein